MPLANTLALGASGSTNNYDLQYADKTESIRSVSGLAPNAAKKLRIGHKTSASGKQVETLLESQITRVNPADTTGASRVDRMSLVCKRGDFTSLADFQAQCEVIRSFLAVPANQTALYDGAF